MLRRYGIGFILGKLSEILRIPLLLSTHLHLIATGGCPTKACNEDSLAIDSLRLRISKER